MSFPDFSPLELTILDHIQHITDAEAHIFVKDGEDVVDLVVYPAMGGDLPMGVVSRLNSGEQLRLLHNHPTGASLSRSDLSVLAHHPSLEIFAITPNGSIHGGRLVDDIHAQELMKQLSKLDLVEQQMQLMIGPTNIQPLPIDEIDDVTRVVGIYRNQRLSEVGAFDFYCSPSPDDSAITLSLYKSALRKSWKKLLLQQFP